MKTRFFIITLLIACVSIAQTPFEGTITFAITFDGLPEQAKSLMTNSDMKMFIKNGNTRTELNMIMVENINIYDAKTQTTNILMNVMGQKYFIKQKSEDFRNKKDSLAPVVTYSDETKTIAGYNCKKATIKNGEEIATLVWYTEEIPNNVSNDKSMQGLQSLKGMPMEFEVKQPEQGFTMRMAATKVQKEKIDDTKFIVPADYKETTKEELMQSFQKNMQEK